MMLAFWNITPQVFADAVALGAVYALMAVGIGLVFGVLRLVNFAYGQLVMAGAFALALASEWGWPLWAGIVLCFAVVLALSLRDGLPRLPAAARPHARRDARRDVRGRVPAPEHRAASGSGRWGRSRARSVT